MNEIHLIESPMHELGSIYSLKRTENILVSWLEWLTAKQVTWVQCLAKSVDHTLRWMVHGGHYVTGLFPGCGMTGVLCK